MTQPTLSGAPVRSWPRLYALVLGSLLLEIGLFYALMRYFS